MSFFRETLTILAIVVVLALTAALTAPFFIDWSAHRAWIENTLTDALGTRVEIAGDIDLRLLPAPRFDLSGVAIGASGPDSLHLRAERMRIEIAAAPLLRGAVRFIEARLDQPHLVLPLSADGAPPTLRPAANTPEAVAFERFEVRGGTIEIVRPGAKPVVIGDVSLDADAGSLAGPFRGSGSFVLDGRRSQTRFGAAFSDDGRLRVKSVVDTAGAPASHLEFDGAAIVERTGDRPALRVEGALVLAGVATAGDANIPWRASGALLAQRGRAAIDPLELRFGPEDRQTTATGSAVLGGEFEGVSVRLSAPQIDLDRLLGGGGENETQQDQAPHESSPQQAATAMARLARLVGDALEQPARERRLAIAVAASAPAVQIGGDTLTETRLELRLRPGEETGVAFSTNLPGRGRVSLDGVVEGGAGARFIGAAEAGARDLPRLAEWIGRASPDFAERLRSLPVRSLEASGRVEFSRNSFAGRDIELRADRSTFNGTLAFGAAVGNEPARLFADLRSPALDLDGLPNLRGPARALQDVDLNIALDARAVRLARLGEGVVDAGRIRLRLARSAGRLELERLSIENLGGATLTASGAADGSSARIEARLDAERLVELAALLRRVAPGPEADALAERAPALSPARIGFAAEAAVRDGEFDLRSLSIQGSARGTRIEGAARPVGGDIEAQIEASSRDSPMLLRQLGIEAIPIAGSPPGRIVLSARGANASGFQAKITGDVAGSAISYTGRLATRDGALSLQGRGQIAARNAAPLLQILAAGPPDVQTALPLDLAADLSLIDGSLRLSGVAGALAGSKISGHLAFAAAPGSGRRALSGSLAIDRASLDALAALALGRPSEARRGALWSDRPFSGGLPDPPPAEIDMKIGALALRGGLTGRDARFRLTLSQGAVAFEDMSMLVGEAGLGGRLALRRDKGEASLAARIDLEAPLDAPGRLQARLAARVELAATGRSERALIDNLAGSGQARLTDIRVPRVDPGALDRVIAAVEKDALVADEPTIVTNLARELERGNLSAKSAAFDVVVAGGVLRLQPAPLKGPDGARVSGWGALDLRNLALEQVVEIESEAPPKDWTGPNPRVRVVWSGAIGKTQRAIDGAILVNALSARAIVRESARVEALEADIRERAFFNRRLRGDEWLRMRAAEIRTFLAEEERKAAEARKRAEEEARRKAEEERKAAEEARRKAIEEEKRAAAEEAARIKAEQARAEQARRDAERRAQESQRILLEDLMRPTPLESMQLRPPGPPLQLVPPPAQ